VVRFESRPLPPPRRLRRGRKPASASKVTKLVRKRGGTALPRKQRGGSRMQRRLGRVAARDRLQMADQGWGQRQHHQPTGLLGGKPQLALQEIDVGPSQGGDVAEALAGINPKENHRTPSRVGDRESRLEFGNRECHDSAEVHQLYVAIGSQALRAAAASLPEL
jgi:hypothetical protein